MNGFIAALSGLLFGVGLVISGMADPDIVLAFLTVGPGWDPALAFVMGGALAVTLPGITWIRKRGKSLTGAPLPNPPTQQIDARLLGGAALFGIGWGLIGYCPGPAIVAAGLLQSPALWFLPAMIAGAALLRWIEARRAMAAD